jgi:predicted nucleic acid-binding protein
MRQVTPRAVLDANVLFPFTLRDTLLRAAAIGLFEVYWSEQILEETTRNLVATERVNEAGAIRLTTAMRAAFPDAMVHSFEDLMPSMANHPGDRHVVAVAAKAAATHIVTQNLKHFRPLPVGLSAIGPDEFLQRLLHSAPDEVVQLLRRQANALQRPMVTLDSLLSGLATQAPGFAAAVRARLP